jgi:transcription elongation factor GreA
MDKYPMTREGYDRLQKELKQLKGRDRPEVIKAIADAREHGDLSENAEYHAAKERQAFIEGRIMDLGAKSARADIIDITKMSGKMVRFGAKVTLVDEENDHEIIYRIVSDYEADLKNGFISIQSPIARAVIGRSEGDSVEVDTPKGIKYYEILSVDFA